MTLDPVPCDLVGLQQRQKLLPEIDIQRGLFVGFDPALRPPCVDPALHNGVRDVFRVRVKLHMTRLLQRAQRGDDARQFHAVVGRLRFAAGKLLFHAVPLENRAPAARTGIAGAGAVGVDRDCSHSSIFKTAMNASDGTETVPKVRMRFLPSFCFSRSFFFRVISPP